MSVAENIFLGREPRQRLGLLDLRELHERAAQLLKRLGVQLDTSLAVSELTIAQQQLVEIANEHAQSCRNANGHANLHRRLTPRRTHRPTRHLIRPTNTAGGELDQLFDIIAALKAQGVTVVYISHRLEEVFRIADEVTVLKDGEVVDSRPIAQLDRPTLVKLMVGRSLDEIFPQTAHEQGDLILTADDVATDTILDGVSLRLHAGEILGIAGMVGSGRTELARALFGADPLTRGEVRLTGKDSGWKTPSQAIRSGVALVPEDRKSQGLFTALSVRINVTIPILRRLSQWALGMTLCGDVAAQAAKKNKSLSTPSSACPSS